MYHTLLEDAFDEAFGLRPGAGFPDPGPLEPDHELDVAIAHQDAAGLRLDLLSDQALLDLVGRVGAELRRREVDPLAA